MREEAIHNRNHINIHITNMEGPVAGNYGQSYGTVNPVYGAAAMSAAPSAPPAGMFDTVPGYEGTVAGGGGGYLPPPMPTVPMPMPQAPSQPNWQIPSISEDRAREALRTYVSSNCCYRSAPVNDGVITNMETFNTYRYRLETFTESRSSEWSNEPYTGQTVDAGVQLAPAPWQIVTKPANFFQDQKQTIKVPYTSSVKNCHMCLGMGRGPCNTCSGAGNKVCWSCNGTGRRQIGDDPCITCRGGGRENCSSCNGQGNRQCDTCRGKRQLLVYINVNVKWTTEKDDFVAQQSSGLKVQNLESVSGKQLFQDTQYMLYPVLGFPDVSVAQASDRLVKEHQAKYAQTSRVLQQRQTIELIPITRVNYMWKGKSYVYFVYGNECQVNAEDYPATCCCSVM